MILRGPKCFRLCLICYWLTPKVCDIVPGIIRRLHEKLWFVQTIQKPDYSENSELFNLLSSWSHQKSWDIQLQLLSSCLINSQQPFQLLTIVPHNPWPSPLHISSVSPTRAGPSRNSVLCLNTHLDSREQFAIGWGSRMWEVLFGPEEVVDSCCYVVKTCWT